MLEEKVTITMIRKNHVGAQHSQKPLGQLQKPQKNSFVIIFCKQIVKWIVHNAMYILVPNKSRIGETHNIFCSVVNSTSQSPCCYLWFENNLLKIKWFAINGEDCFSVEIRIGKNSCNLRSEKKVVLNSVFWPLQVQEEACVSLKNRRTKNSLIIFEGLIFK